MINQRWPRVRKNGREADIGGNIAPRERLLTGHLSCIGISGGIPNRLFGTCLVLLIWNRARLWDLPCSGMFLQLIRYG